MIIAMRPVSYSLVGSLSDLLTYCLATFRHPADSFEVIGESVNLYYNCLLWV
jgi:hypothetical protein